MRVEITITRVRGDWEQGESRNFGWKNLGGEQTFFTRQVDLKATIYDGAGNELGSMYLRDVSIEAHQWCAGFLIGGCGREPSDSKDGLKGENWVENLNKLGIDWSTWGAWPS